MKDFNRSYTLFSLCGLNCGLCLMHLDDYCPGCGGGAGNQSCKIARCSQQHCGIEYCYLCDEYPCEKYDGIDLFDSFITHRNQIKDFEKVKKIGINIYKSQLEEKIEILKYLLANYNDGRRKNFFSIAVYLLDLEDVKSGMKQIAAEAELDNLTLNEKATFVVNQFKTIAAKRNILLRLNKKPARSSS